MYYPGSATLFRTDGNALQHGLSEKFESLDEIVLAGNHFELLDPAVGQLRNIAEKVA